MKTYIVHGPRGCGKTQNAHAIARQLGVDPSQVIDDAGPDLRGKAAGVFPAPGHVYLTTDPDFVADWLTQGGIRPSGIQAIKFSDIEIQEAML